MSEETFSINPAFKVEQFKNEIILYSVSEASGIYLNETAYLVWQMCGQAHSVGEIILLLEGAYPKQKVSIREDVPQAVELLVATGALLTNRA